ncbi:prealbumin-like fold domain-containing protein, partial [Ruminococcus callidus]
ISWTSDNAKGSVTLSKLPAGTYKLEEITSPDGFTLKTEEMTFTVDSKGNVTTASNLTKNDNGNGVIMEDEASSVSIVKVGKDGESTKELPGASMKLTYTGTGDADLSKV